MAALQATVWQLKCALQAPTGLPAPRQRIIYRGRVPQDSEALTALGVQSGHVLHLVESAPAQQRPPGRRAAGQQGARAVSGTSAALDLAPRAACMPQTIAA